MRSRAVEQSPEFSRIDRGGHRGSAANVDFSRNLALRLQIDAQFRAKTRRFRAETRKNLIIFTRFSPVQPVSCVNPGLMVLGRGCRWRRVKQKLFQALRSKGAADVSRGT
jgi:hypothetical protein